jgi:hypothetical protein
MQIADPQHSKTVKALFTSHGANPPPKDASSTTKLKYSITFRMPKNFFFRFFSYILPVGKLSSVITALKL